MPVGDVYECKFFTRHLDGQVAVNVRHYRVNGITGTEPTAQEKADEVSTLIGTNLRNMIADSWEYRGMQLRQVKPTVTAAIISTAGGGQGALIGFSLPPQNSPHISLLSSFAPARVRGRFYVPCPTIAQVTATGKITPAFQFTLDTLGDALIVDIDVDPAVGVRQCLFRPVILSVVHDQDYALTQHIIHAGMATQRRRSNVNRGDSSPI